MPDFPKEGVQRVVSLEHINQLLHLHSRRRLGATLLTPWLGAVFAPLTLRTTLHRASLVAGREKRVLAVKPHFASFARNAHPCLIPSPAPVSTFLPPHDHSYTHTTKIEATRLGSSIILLVFSATWEEAEDRVCTRPICTPLSSPADDWRSSSCSVFASSDPVCVCTRPQNAHRHDHV